MLLQVALTASSRGRRIIVLWSRTLQLWWGSQSNWSQRNYGKRNA